MTGRDTFSEKGDLVAKPLAKLVVQHGKFVFFDHLPPLAQDGRGADRDTAALR